jgi:HEAT repeat protein
MLGAALAFLLISPPVQAAAPLDSEPSYHGKRLKQWVELSRDEDPKVRLRAVVHVGLGPFNKAAVPALRKSLRDEDRTVRLAAIVALGEIGTEAAEAADDLGARLKEEDPDACVKICEALANFGSAGVPALMDALKDDNREVRRAAVIALSEMGPDAKAAGPVLAAIFRHIDSKSPYNEAKQALMSIGEPAVPALIDALKDPSEDVRRWSLEALWTIGPAAKAAIPAVLERMEEEDLRACAIGVLDSMGAKEPAVVDALRKALADPNPEVRDAAADALRNLGPAAKPARKLLVAALKAEYIHVSAAEALARMGEIALPDVAAAARDEPSARAAAFALILMGKAGVPEFRKVLADRNPRIRAACLWALVDASGSVLGFFPDLKENRSQAFRLLAPELPVVLVKQLKDEDVDVRRSAAWALKHFPCDSAGTNPALREALKDADPTVRRPALLAICVSDAPVRKQLEIVVAALEDADSAVRADALCELDRMKRDAEPVVPSLVKLLENNQKNTRCDILRLLRDIGPQAKAAVPALTKALEDSDSGMRVIAAEALGNIGPEAKEAAGSLRAGLIDEDECVAVAAARALWFIEREKSGAIPILAHFLGVPDKGKGTMVALSAALALGEIGPGAKDAVPALVKALKRDDFVRGEAARTLGRIGPDADAAIPALSEMLSDVEAEEFFIALDSLRHIGVAAIPALTDALHSPRWHVRCGACDALGRIGPPAKKAVPALTEALYDPNAFVRQSAAEALRAFGPDAKTAVGPLAETLGDHYGDVAWKAAETLQCLGPSAKRAVPALAAVLRTEREEPPRSRNRRPSRIGPKGRELAFIAIETLGHFGPDAAGALPELRSACTDTDAWLRATAAVALWRVEGKKDPVLPVLKAALKDKNSRARIAAAQGLWDVDRSKDGFSVLLAELQSEVVHDRAEATKALWHIGPDARELVPNLLKLLEDKYAHYYDEAAEALKKIDPEAAKKAGVR